MLDLHKFKTVKIHIQNWHSKTHNSHSKTPAIDQLKLHVEKFAVYFGS